MLVNEGEDNGIIGSNGDNRGVDEFNTPSSATNFTYCN